MTDTSKSIDPSTLPPNLMGGLQAAAVGRLHVTACRPEQGPVRR